MDSINFCESPALGLARQSTQRLQWLMFIMAVWFVWVSAIFMGLNVLVNIKNNKAAALKISLEEMQPSILAHQHLIQKQQQQKKSECAARVLNDLINSPVKDVMISGLTLTDRWKIHGKSVNQQALGEFQIFVDKMMTDPLWDKEGDEFTVSGSMAC